MSQPPVVGALVAGLLLEPSGLGLAWPRASNWLFPPAGPAHDALQAVSQLSLLTLVVALSSETDLALMRSLGRQTAPVGAASIVVPLAAGVTLASLLPAKLLGSDQERLPFALLLGGAISVTSLPVVARIVNELDLARRNLGQAAAPPLLQRACRLAGRALAADRRPAQSQSFARAPGTPASPSLSEGG